MLGSFLVLRANVAEKPGDLQLIGVIARYATNNHIEVAVRLKP